MLVEAEHNVTFVVCSKSNEGEVSMENNTDSDTVYEVQCRKTRKRLVGVTVDRKVITDVGRPVDARANAPTLVPVQFANGTFGILWGGRLMESSNPEVLKAIKASMKMPLVSAGLGSDVMHVVAYPPRKRIDRAYIKIYYNEKSDRGDTIRYVPS